MNSISDRTIVQYRVCPGSPAQPHYGTGMRGGLFSESAVLKPCGSVGSGVVSAVVRVSMRVRWWVWMADVRFVCVIVYVCPV